MLEFDVVRELYFSCTLSTTGSRLYSQVQLLPVGNEFSSPRGPTNWECCPVFPTQSFYFTSDPFYFEYVFECFISCGSVGSCMLLKDNIEDIISDESELCMSEKWPRYHRCLKGIWVLGNHDLAIVNDSCKSHENKLCDGQNRKYEIWMRFFIAAKNYTVYVTSYKKLWTCRVLSYTYLKLGRNFVKLNPCRRNKTEILVRVLLGAHNSSNNFCSVFL